MKNREAPHAYYPVMLNVRDKKCLVIGGGIVALRKARMLMEHGARVVLVSPEIVPELSRLADGGLIKTMTREYETKDLNDAFLVIAATDNARLNEKVATETRKKKILVNVVDKPDISDFIVPAYFRNGEIIVAVSTSGKSPALARKIKNELENELRTEYSQLAEIAGDVRNELKKKGIPVTAEEWQAALDLNSLIDLIKRHKIREAKEIMLAKLTSVTSRES